MCRKFLRETRDRFSSLLLGSIPFTHRKIIFFYYISPFENLLISVSIHHKMLRFSYSWKKKKTAVFIKRGQDTPGLQSSNPNSQIRQRNGFMFIVHGFRNSLSSTHRLKRSLKSLIKILQETALNRSLTVTNKYVLARKLDKMPIAQIQSLIKEKAMQGIDMSICLLILEEDIYFENLVTNIQKWIL